MTFRFRNRYCTRDFNVPATNEKSRVTNNCQGMCVFKVTICRVMHVNAYAQMLMGGDGDTKPRADKASFNGLDFIRFPF